MLGSGLLCRLHSLPQTPLSSYGNPPFQFSEPLRLDGAPTEATVAIPHCHVERPRPRLPLCSLLKRGAKSVLGACQFLAGRRSTACVERGACQKSHACQLGARAPQYRLWCRPSGAASLARFRLRESRRTDRDAVPVQAGVPGSAVGAFRRPFWRLFRAWGAPGRLLTAELPRLVLVAEVRSRPAPGCRQEAVSACSLEASRRAP